MKKRTLIAGGAGFIGSHLTKRLLYENHEVVVVDNFSTGKIENLMDVLNHPLLQILQHDVTLPLFIEVDEIYNLASPASPIQYQKEPVQTIKTNVIGAIHLLDLAKNLKVPILQASTSEIYGDPEISPQNEEYFGNVNPIGIRACYDEGKRAAETLFFDYHRQYGLDTKIVRIFNTYGPNLDFNDGRVVSNFIIQALSNSPITIYGDGSQTRSFCYVDDLVTGLIKMMRSKEQGPINLGNPNEMSVLTLAKKIIGMTQSSSSIVFESLPIDDPKRRQPDIRLAVKKLNFEPIIAIDEGLNLTIDYFKERLKES
jgi:UDP-glucuronate decarboxylase